MNTLLTRAPARREGRRLSRRRFLHHLGNGGAIAALATGFSPRLLLAAQGQTGAPELTGNHFQLAISRARINVSGRERPATLINGSLPGPTLRWREGETVTIDVTNHMDVDTSLHWHGILLPTDMDGVPHMSFDGIQPGETFRYQFKVKQSGTYWYHSHSGFQEQTGVYGAIVIDPAREATSPPQRDYVVMLSDWSDTPPENIYATLKKVSHYYNFNERTVFDTLRDFRDKGVIATLKDRHMWNMMRMSDSDISDVTGYTYQFLMNGRRHTTNETREQQHWTGLYQPGDRIRLRFINAAAMTFFDVRIPGLKMTVVATDGMPVKPVTVDEFRIATAETYDVIVEPQSAGAWSLFAQAIDRSGFVCGTLTSDPALRAEPPAMDPVPVLGHREMGMDHSSMNHEGMNHEEMNHAGTTHEGMNHSAMDHSSMDHASMTHSPDAPVVMDHSSMDQEAMNHATMNQEAMDHAAMNHAATDQPAIDSGKVDTGKMDPGKMDHAKMDHAEMNHTGVAHADMDRADMDRADMANSAVTPTKINPDLLSRKSVSSHLPSEFGPQVDMRADMPMSMLDDPGIGLRNNGRRVLVYKDLEYLHGLPDSTTADREITWHLTGNMHRYQWSINGIAYHDAQPLKLAFGERVRITLVNDTMMHHPIHLHGMWSDLETGDGRLARKHTIVVKPGEQISYLVRADARGRWAYHCHLLYHMEAGMFREVQVL